MGNVKRRRVRTEARDRKVGYGSPPKQSQFKAGQSGNPKGRPKGARNFKTDVKVTLQTPVKVTREGKPRKISTQEAALLRLREKALGGDPRALDRLIALAQMYSDDEPSVSVKLSDEDENVLQIYRQRVLSGAIPSSELIESSCSSDETRGLNATAETPEIMPVKDGQIEFDQPSGAKIAASNTDMKK